MNAEDIRDLLHAAVVLEVAAQQIGAVGVVLGVVVQQLAEGAVHVVREDTGAFHAEKQLVNADVAIVHYRSLLHHGEPHRGDRLAVAGMYPVVPQPVV